MEINIDWSQDYFKNIDKTNVNSHKDLIKISFYWELSLEGSEVTLWISVGRLTEIYFEAHNKIRKSLIKLED